MEEMLINMIENHGFIAILASFVIGAITSLAPCSILTLPLLMGTVLKMSADMDEKKKKRFIYLFSTLFVLGLIISFSILAFIVAKFGGFLSIAPYWVYFLASGITLLVALYGLGVFPSADKSKIIEKFIRFKLFGAILIGAVFGIVSTPCASAPLAAIIAVASQSNYFYSYVMVMAFAVGHALLLFISGISMSFTSKVAKSKKLGILTSIMNKGFTLILVGIAIYFFIQGYKQF